MSRLRTFFATLTALFRRKYIDQDLDDELRSHIDEAASEFERDGLTPEAARRRALLQFGNITGVREAHRELRTVAWLGELGRDVRYALRVVKGNVGFTVAVVLTIGIAIGGAVAVFSLIDAVLLRALPYRDAGDLVVVGEGDARGEVAPVNFALLLSHNEAFIDIAAMGGYGPTLKGDRPEKLVGRRVTHTFFQVLGVAPALGRTFRADEDAPGGARVAIISHNFWRDRFGADPSVIGRDLLLDDNRFSVVGVMPAAFQFLTGDVNVWVPAAFTPQQLTNGANQLTIVARLKPDIGVDQARANLDSQRSRLAATLPPAADGFQMRVTTLREFVAGDTHRPLLMLLAAVTAVMLIACANVAGLLVARAAARRSEIALRTSLGATRARLIRQLFAESLVLATMGLGLGLVIASAAVVFLDQFVPPGAQLFAHPTIGLRTLGFAVLITVAACIVFGLAPAVHASTLGLGSVLRSSGRGVTGATTRRGFLVVAQMAMTLVLLVVAGLLIQSLYRLRYADVGFQPDGVLTLRTALPNDLYNSQARRADFYNVVLERVSRLPDVIGAAYTTSVPLAWKGASTGFAVEGRPAMPGVRFVANHRQVSTDYLRVIGTPLKEGRYFTQDDGPTTQPVVIINEAMARKWWPDGRALGARLKPTDDRPNVVPWMTVVGVVRDVRQMGLDAPVAPEMYVLHHQFDAQAWFAPRDLVVRTTTDPMRLVSAITAEIRAIDPALPVSNVARLTDLLDEDVAARRIGTVTLIAFAGFAVLLAVVGIYGVISYFVLQHTSEIGVRLALGAPRRDVLALVAGKGLRLTVAGIGIGLVGAVAASQLVSGLLYGFAGLDMVVVITAALLLAFLAIGASYLPARRASRLDPVVALRQR